MFLRIALFHYIFTPHDSFLLFHYLLQMQTPCPYKSTVGDPHPYPFPSLQRKDLFQIHQDFDSEYHSHTLDLTLEVRLRFTGLCGLNNFIIYILPFGDENQQPLQSLQVSEFEDSLFSFNLVCKLSSIIWNSSLSCIKLPNIANSHQHLLATFVLSILPHH